MNAATLETIEFGQGRISGVRRNGIIRFAGIPYAKPPVGPLRWQMPEAAEPWSGVRDGTHFATVCPQAPTQIEKLTGMTMGEQSEDCLYLNVWTPGCDDAKRPVMVWIHGGAFMIGAGSQSLYDGEALAARDVVVVTINYRLGAFGFLNLRDASDGALPGTGTEGLADQILALHWVKENIAEFGGDPDNITIFGESAGGMSAAALLAAPSARGLFHKAITQSGAAHIGHDRDRSTRVSRTVLEQLGLDPGNAKRARDLSYGELVRAQIAVQANTREGQARNLGRLPFQPTIDGQILEQRPIDAIRAGGAAGIPLMSGTTREEWKLFTAADPRLRLMSAKSLAERIERAAGDAAGAMLAAYGEGSAFDRFNLFMTDRIFTMPSIRLLEAQGKTAPVYGYRFDWRSKLLGGFMGSCHALELGFVFGTYNEGMSGAFFGKGPDAEALSSAMIEAWTNFARTGSPGADWPHYDEQSRATMIFGDGAPRLDHAPNEQRRLAWETVPERRLGT